MNEDTVVRLAKPGSVSDELTELLRNGAVRLIEQAVAAEFDEFLVRYAERRDERGRRAVVRNGYQPERAVLTGIGPVTVKVPKVRSRGEGPAVFRSHLVPPYVRRARSIEAALPWLYLHGISTGNMAAALEVLVGPNVRGLSAPVVSRLKRVWAGEYEAWRKRRLDQDRWVYLWADGIYSGLRADDKRLCALVVIGVNERGQKRFLAIEDGVRESTQSWREVLLDLKARGFTVPAKLAVGDGALGFWAALEEIYPETVHQRCWVHKTANVLNYLPNSVRPKAKAALHEIWMAETREAASVAFDQFIATYQAKYPKATDCLAKDRRALLAFYDFPAEHWQHVRSTNVIESTFATIRHRSDQANGCVTRDSMLAFLYKLGMSAEKSWRRVRGFEWLAKIIEGVQFKDGIEARLAARKSAVQKGSRVAA
jgi:putative transposase